MMLAWDLLATILKATHAQVEAVAPSCADSKSTDLMALVEPSAMTTTPIFAAITPFTTSTTLLPHAIQDNHPRSSTLSLRPHLPLKHQLHHQLQLLLRTTALELLELLE